MQLDALLLAFCSQFLQHIPFEWGSIHNVVIRFLGIEHREAIMVTAGDGDVLGTRSLDLRHPFCRIELRRIETRSQLGILIPMDVTVVHVPLAPGGHAIDAPMQEDAELVVLKLLTSLQVLGSRYIRLRHRSCSGTQTKGCAQYHLLENILFHHCSPFN